MKIIASFHFYSLCFSRASAILLSHFVCPWRKHTCAAHLIWCALFHKSSKRKRCFESFLALLLSSVMSFWPSKMNEGPTNGDSERDLESPPGKRARPADFELILKRSKSTDFFDSQSSVSLSSSSSRPTHEIHPEDMDAQVNGTGSPRPIFSDEKVVNDWWVHDRLKFYHDLTATVVK